MNEVLPMIKNLACVIVGFVTSFGLCISLLVVKECGDSDVPPTLARRFSPDTAFHATSPSQLALEGQLPVGVIESVIEEINKHSPSRDRSVDELEVVRSRYLEACKSALDFQSKEHIGSCRMYIFANAESSGVAYLGWRDSFVSHSCK